MLIRNRIYGIGAQGCTQVYLANSLLSSMRCLRRPLARNWLAVGKKNESLGDGLSYGFPCCRSLPAALTALSLPCSFKSSYDMISPHTNLFSKSELVPCRQEEDTMKTVETYWMTPAAWGAFVPFRIVHALTSSGPQVKYRINLEKLDSHRKEM